VFAVVAGWSRLVERNDVETLGADVIEPKIAEHRGRLLEVAVGAKALPQPRRQGRTFRSRPL
jgi:hypothetical protein